MDIDRMHIYVGPPLRAQRESLKLWGGNVAMDVLEAVVLPALTAMSLSLCAGMAPPGGIKHIKTPKALR